MKSKWEAAAKDLEKLWLGLGVDLFGLHPEDIQRLKVPKGSEFENQLKKFQELNKKDPEEYLNVFCEFKFIIEQRSFGLEDN